MPYDGGVPLPVGTGETMADVLVERVTTEVVDDVMVDELVVVVLAGLQEPVFRLQ